MLCLAIKDVLEIDEQVGHLPPRNLLAAKQSSVASLYHIRVSVGEWDELVGVAAE